MQLPYLFFALLFLNCISCSPSTTHQSSLDSNHYSDRKERIKILTQEIKSFSAFEDAEFDLFNVNGFSNSKTSVPGASYWDYKFVIKLDSAHIDPWINQLTQTSCDTTDQSWMNQLIQKRASKWTIVTSPECYKDSTRGLSIIIYRTEGILFKRVIQH